MVYGVFGGCYSDWYVVGYFNNRQGRKIDKINKMRRSVLGYK